MEWSGKVTMSSRVGAYVEMEGGYLVPRRVTMTWTADASADNPGPDLVAHFEIRNGAPECRAVHITAATDGRGVAESDLALLNLTGNARAAFIEQAATPAPDGGHSLPLMTAIPSKEEERQWSEVRGSGWPAHGKQQTHEGQVAAVKMLDRSLATRPASRSARELIETARVYLNDASGAPAKEVQRRVGLDSYRTATRRIEQARKAGLIPPAGASAEEYEAARIALEELDKGSSAKGSTMTLDEAAEWVRASMGRDAEAKS